ncbi:hypothetical protein DFA_10647 [Cavenderia fasciculata]|uniref:Uncharacterized protein n=1 Tax=Cavenderia fasciculata TaxID=261658 RepID=F4QB02_CACFS|nr:uncharacterized protein DFA_10647 [Cavenderia fasciculata]EGG14774.1 hypothetical protein DFA_10647 [Cavenderia fasciculata]|eukprot:XP_004351290.1 hypothetical protein DFA_10647 [Cavenderia fasciculata]
MNNKDNNNNDNSKIDDPQSSCVISRVFKDRYLLYSIVQRIRRECLVLGAMMPIEKSPPPIRYHWVPRDPVLTIEYRQYNLLIDYIKSTPKDGHNSIFWSLVGLGLEWKQMTHQQLSQLFQLFSEQFKKYFGISADNPKDQTINNIFKFLTTTKWEYQSWKIIIDFINTHCIIYNNNNNQEEGQSTSKKKIITKNNKRKQPSTKQTNSTTTILKIFLETNSLESSPWIWVLLREYLLLHENVQILDDIIQEVGVKALLDAKDDGKRIDPPKTSRVMGTYIGANLDSKMIHRIYKKPLDSALKSHNKDFVSKALKGDPQKNQIYDIRTFIYDFLSGDINLDDAENLLQDLKSLVECIHILHPDMGNLNETIHESIGYPMSSPPSVPYFILWLFGYWTSTTTFFKVEDEMAHLIVSLFSRIENNNKDQMIKYLIYNLGFSTICAHGSLELVQLSYQHVMKGLSDSDEPDSDDPDPYFIRFQSTDIKVLEFLVGILKQQDLEYNEHGKRSIIRVNSVEMASHCDPELVEPLFESDSPVSDIALAIGLFDYFSVLDEPIRFRKLERMLEMAINSFQAPLIIYMYKHYNKNPLNFDPYHHPPPCNMDRLVKEHQFLLIKELIDNDVPMVINDSETWMIIGRYASTEWIDILLKYTNPTILSNNNNINNNNNDNSKINDSQNSCVISRVFKDRYLLYSIVQRIRRGGCLVLGAMMPNEKNPPIRYHWITPDPVLTIEYRQYNLLLDCIKSTPKDDYDSMFEALTELGLEWKHITPLQLSQLFQLFSEQFKRYFGISSANPNQETMTTIFKFLTTTKWEYQSWKMIIDFINTHSIIYNNIDDDKGQQSTSKKMKKNKKKTKNNKTNKPSTTTTTKRPPTKSTILKIFLETKTEDGKSSWIWVLLREYLLLHENIQILDNIIQEIGVKALLDAKDGRERIDSLKFSRVVGAYVGAYVGNNLDSKMINRIFKKPLDSALKSHNKEFVSKALKGDPQKNRVPFIRTHIFDFLSEDINLDDKDHLLQDLKSLVECIHILHPDMGNLNETIHESIGYPMSSPPSVPYFILWLFHYWMSTATTTVKVEDEMARLIVSLFSKTNDNKKNQMIKYLIHNLGFSTICAHGSLELVQLSYQHIMESLPNIDESEHHFVRFESTDIKVLEFLVGILKQQDLEYNQHGKFIHPRFILHPDIVSSLDGFISPVFKGELLEYMVMQVSEILNTRKWSIDNDSIKVILRNGYFKVADVLLVKAKMLHSLGYGSKQIAKVNSLQMARYSLICDPQSADPSFESDSPDSNIALAIGLFDFYSVLDLPTRLRKLEKMLEMAINSFQAPLIIYMYKHYNKNPLNFDPYLYPPPCNMDRLVRDHQFLLIKELIDNEIPMAINDSETWRIIGRYASRQWIDILMKYTNPAILKNRKKVKEFFLFLETGLDSNLEAVEIIEYISENYPIYNKLFF